MRYDILNYKDYMDYELSKYLGLMCSYERENYDLIRGAFLKYFFQLRLGDMDGIFVSYHNTEKTFGFEYIKRDLIEKIIFGS
jgi:hypothetical protein